MLRQDSIQSADLKKKESPFRAKCHEIFCCPLKQVHHKENTEPEGLCTMDPCYVRFFPPFFFLYCSCPYLVLYIPRPVSRMTWGT